MLDVGRWTLRCQSDLIFCLRLEASVGSGEVQGLLHGFPRVLDRGGVLLRSLCFSLGLL